MGCCDGIGQHCNIRVVAQQCDTDDGDDTGIPPTPLKSAPKVTPL